MSSTSSAACSPSASLDEDSLLLCVSESAGKGQCKFESYLERLVKCESPTGSPILCNAAAKEFVQIAKEIFDEITPPNASGSATRAFTGPPADHSPFLRSEFLSDTLNKYGDHLLLTFSLPCMTESKPLLLIGHHDTVFNAGDTPKNPFRVTVDEKSGREQLRGEGILDMKFGCLASIFSVHLLLAAGYSFRHPLLFLSCSDEEVGSPSSSIPLLRLASTACAALVFEPALDNGFIKIARSACAAFRLHSTGKSAHAGVCPEAGVNALVDLSLQVPKLLALANSECGTTVSCTGFSSGQANHTNIIPDCATMEVDVRVRNRQEMSRINEEFSNLKSILPGAKLEVRGGFHSPPFESSASKPLFEIVQPIINKLKLEISGAATGGASAANVIAEKVNTIDGLGAVGGGAHTFEEFIWRDQIAKRISFAAGILLAIDQRL